MKKILLLFIVLLLTLVGCSNSIPKLRHINNMTEEQVEEKLIGLQREELINYWGKPFDECFGFYGDIWKLDTYNVIVVYYDDDSIVMDVKLTQLN